MKSCPRPRALIASRAPGYYERLIADAHLEYRAPESDCAGLDALKRELDRFGVNVETIPHFEGTLAAMAAMPEDQPTWIDERTIDYLTRLILEGRFLAFTADMADPAVAKSAQRALAAHRTQLRAINLSNILEYIPDTEAVRDNLAHLPLSPDCRVISTAAAMAMRGDLEGADRAAAALLGKFEEPAVHAAADFIHGDVGRRITDVLWRLGWKSSWASVSKMVSRLGFPIDDIDPPQTIEAFRAVIARIMERAFGDEEMARGILRRYAEVSGAWEAYGKVEMAETLSALELPVPKSIEDVITSFRRFEAEFWTSERKVAFIRMTAGESAELPTDLEARVRDLRSTRDLRVFAHRLWRNRP